MRWKRHDDERKGKIIIELEGRIDTNNAPQTDKEIMEILSKNAGKELVFDINNLQYISKIAGNPCDYLQFCFIGNSIVPI